MDAKASVKVSVTVGELSPDTITFYHNVMRALQEAHVPFLVGGAYAFAHYTGIIRHTKDLDIFLRQADLEPARTALGSTGYASAVAAPHWLAKVHAGNDAIDLIFSSGNGLCNVDDGWFSRAKEHEVLAVSVWVCPPEEMIWQKAFIMERERYDGADVAHLLRACATELDWDHLLSRFGSHWRILLSHLILFGFVYPSERGRIPQRVLRELLGRLEQEQKVPVPEHLCQGTLLSRSQYLADVKQWEYQDARLSPWGTMDEEEVQEWTAATGDNAPSS